MSQFHKLTGNWGFAIILLVLLIKAVFFKLSEAQYRSMAKMRKMQPRVAALKERYGDDRQKLNQAMLELYQKEKINPLGGCLPMLVQIPVFLGLYWVLLESVELRQAPFILWIHNLTAPDPYYVLPILNAATMLATQFLTPMTGMDPLQAKMMKFMPLIFSVLFAFFPAGLVLYWTVNGALGLLQQWIITRRIEGGAKPAAVRGQIAAARTQRYRPGAMSGQGETIAAIATAPGAGGIGIIRLQRHRSQRRSPVACSAARRKPRHAHYCAFHRCRRRRCSIAGCCCTSRRRTRSPARMSLELQVHGSPVMLRCLLERCIELGARHARPGEFSERAFLNGKIDLAQAEAIADLIASGSEAAARAAVRSLEGEFSRQVDALTEAVVRLRIWIEAAIDFPEEEIDFLATPTLIDDLAALRSQLEGMLAASRRGVRLLDGLHVVIVGRPNAGKSSLLNALAASERAIVTEVAGTTRDVLRETIDLDGIALTLVDTAGLRESADLIEMEGMRRARAELERADLAVLVSRR